MELLLNRKEVRGVTHYLVRWHGRTSESAFDEWLRAEDLHWSTARRRWRSTRQLPLAPDAARPGGAA